MTIASPIHWLTRQQFEEIYPVNDDERKAWEVEQMWEMRNSAYPPALILRRQWTLQRYEEQNGLCAYCGDVMIVMTREDVISRPDLRALRATCDHVTPRALGGLDDLENIVAACHDCNNAKGDIPPREFVRWIQAVASRGLEPFQLRAYLRMCSNQYRSRMARGKVAS